MASTSFLPNISEMVERRVNGFGIPILISRDAKGFATISSFCLGIRFDLQDTSV